MGEVKHIDEATRDKVFQLAADTFLSCGTYADLVRSADGEEPLDEIAAWEPFEDYSWEEILESVDDLAGRIIDELL